MGKTRGMTVVSASTAYVEWCYARVPSRVSAGSKKAVSASEIIGPCVYQLHHMDIAHPESRFTIAEIIIPFADKTFVETEVPDLIQPAIELKEPDLQRCGIVQTEVFEIDEGHIA